MAEWRKFHKWDLFTPDGSNQICEDCGLPRIDPGTPFLCFPADSNAQDSGDITTDLKLDPRQDVDASVEQEKVRLKILEIFDNVNSNIPHATYAAMVNALMQTFDIKERFPE